MALSNVHMSEATDHAEMAHICSTHLTDDISKLMLALKENDVNIGEIVAVRDQLAGVAQQIDHAVQSYIRALHSAQLLNYTEPAPSKALS